MTRGMKGSQLRRRREGDGRKGRLLLNLTVHSRVSRFIDARSSVSIVIAYRKEINMLTQVTGSPPWNHTRLLRALAAASSVSSLRPCVLGTLLAAGDESEAGKPEAPPRGSYIH